MRTMKNIILILCFCLLVSMVSCNYKAYDKKPVWVIGRDIINRLNTGEFADIEKYIDHLVVQKPYTADGTRVLEDLYPFVAERLYSNDMLDKWCAKEPSHHSAFIFRGIFYINQAWKFRGSGYAYTVSEEGWRLFKENLNLAEKDLEKAYSMNPEDPNSSASMIIVRKGLSRGEEEMDMWFKRAVEADPIAYKAYSKKQDYLRPKWHGTPEKDKAFAGYCYENAPQKSVIHEIMLDYIIENGKYTKDFKEYFSDPLIKKTIDDVAQRTLKNFPDSTLIRDKLVKIERAMGNLEKVVDLYNEILAIDPGNPEALRLRGNLLNSPRFKKYDQAEADIQRSIESDPDGPNNYDVLASIAERNGNYEKAIEYYTRAIERQPKAIQPYLNRGRIKMRLYLDYDAALKDFREAEKLDNRSIGPIQLIAVCLERMRQFEEAKKYCQKGLDILEIEKSKNYGRTIMPKPSENFERILKDMLRRLNVASNQYPFGKNEIGLPAETLIQYVGTYELRLGFDIVITLEGDRLFSQATGQNKFPIFPESDSKFFYRVVDAQLEFFKDASGSVTHLILTQNGAEIKAPRIRDIVISVTDDYGLSEKTAIKVGGGPKGERDYLDMLCGPKGEKIKYRRLGSCCAFETPNSPFGSGLLDRYEVTYEGSNKPVIVYLNMYDPPTGKRYAPVGLKFINE